MRAVDKDVVIFQLKEKINFSYLKVKLAERNVDTKNLLSFYVAEFALACYSVHFSVIQITIRLAIIQIPYWSD